MYVYVHIVGINSGKMYIPCIKLQLSFGSSQPDHVKTYHLLSRKERMQVVFVTLEYKLLGANEEPSCFTILRPMIFHWSKKRTNPRIIFTQKFQISGHGRCKYLGTKSC